MGSLILIDVIQQLACQTREMSLSLGNHLALKANSSAINCDIKGQKGAKKSAFVRSCEERRKRNQSRLSQLRSTDKQDNGSKLFSRFKCARRGEGGQLDLLLQTKTLNYNLPFVFEVSSINSWSTSNTKNEAGVKIKSDISK